MHIEAQKSYGALHAHGQLFIQCPHRHLALQEILVTFKNSMKELAENHLKFKEHARSEAYCDLDLWRKERTNIELEWSEYAKSSDFMSTPQYLKTDEIEDYTWPLEYLKHPQQIQGMKQNHVHTINPKTKKREPLCHCKRKDKPHLYKSDFPRTSWFIDDSVVICPGLLEKLNLPTLTEKTT